MSIFNQLVALTLPVFPRRMVGFLSRHYIAGEDFADAATVSHQLMQEGCMITVDVLGEHLETMAATEEYATLYQKLPALIDREQLDANLSVKPSQMGLLLDPAGTLENYRSIARAANAFDNFLRIDMEDSSITDIEFDLYRELRSEYPRTGIVIQSYLRRTVDDARWLAADKANVRLCKGIYQEPDSIAYQKRQEIRDSFMETLEILLRGGSYVGIATHDDWLVNRSIQLIDELQLTKEHYEFQMLLGVLPDLRRKLISSGHRLRVYVPFGRAWYAYSTRRLKENPDLINHFMRDFFRSHK
jgi:proline dehydrogenase